VEQPVRVLAGPVGLDGDLATPTAPQGVVLFAHGSGSGRHSPRNRQVASALGGAGFATLLLDLLTLEEEAADRASGRFRFDVELLAGGWGPPPTGWPQNSARPVCRLACSGPAPAPAPPCWPRPSGHRESLR
jgi:hypothetical protein